MSNAGNTETVPIPVERLRDWVRGCRREAVRYPLDSRQRDYLWDLSTVITENIPATLPREGAPE